MNNINNKFNKKDVENKLKDFKEGQDYSVSPVDDGKQIYNFFSDELKRFWGDDRILVNRIVKTDSNKDYDYYGQFENYQDGSYRSFQL
jgi:Fe-S cluster biosynthesis and repair protein YggX